MLKSGWGITTGPKRAKEKLEERDNLDCGGVKVVEFQPYTRDTHYCYICTNGIDRACISVLRTISNHLLSTERGSVREILREPTYISLS